MRTTITHCEKLLRDIINHEAGCTGDQMFLPTVQKRLKLPKPEDWSIICSSLDVLGDTEMAKENFYSTRKDLLYQINLGDRYLRLYGILSVAYLQRNVIKDLLRIFNVLDAKEILKRIDNTDLVKIRHRVGAHTTSVVEDDGSTNTYQHSRAELTRGVVMTSDRTNNFSIYYLEDIVPHFDEIISDILVICCEKFINTVYKNGGSRREKNLKLLHEIKLGNNQQIEESSYSVDDVLRELNSSNFVGGFKFDKDEFGAIVMVPITG